MSSSKGTQEQADPIVLSSMMPTTGQGRLEASRPEGWADVSLRVLDFGPIARGAVVLKPLTLLVGPNNSGKSYAAMLLHSLFETRPPDRDVFGHEPELESQYEPPPPGQQWDLPQEFVTRVVRRHMEERWEVPLSNEISRLMASPLAELVRIGRSSFRLQITSDGSTAELVYAGGPALALKGAVARRMTFHLKGLEYNGHEIEIRRREKGEYDVAFYWPGSAGIHVAHRRHLVGEVAEYIIGIAFSSLSRPCYYLPAARSGILQGHRALAAGLVRMAPYAGIKPMEVPGFSGVVADFISGILTLSERRRGLCEVAERFERDVMQGEIALRVPQQDLPTEIRYRYCETDIPLHRSSSTVSELAPLILYLKYVLEPGGVLIVEEPEAHLHPANQRAMAKLLVECVRKGLCVVVTTHSDWLVQQLSNFIMLSQLESRAVARKCGYSRDLYLRPDEVGAYVFSRERRGHGHKIDSIEVAAEGIPEDEFLRIHEALYEETVAIERDLFGGS